MAYGRASGGLGYIDHGQLPWSNSTMEELSVSRFKATCLAVLEKVRTTREPVLVTKRGEPIAEVVPVSRAGDEPRRLGVLIRRGAVVGDVIEPAVGPEEWESPGP